MRVSSLLLPALVAGAVSGAAYAQPSTWIERNSAIPGVDRNHDAVTGFSFGDDGEFLNDVDVTMGDTPLTTIKGYMVSKQRLQSDGVTNLRSLDADLYCIHISDPASFSAIVTSMGGQDSCLALFRSNGQAVAFNDNRTDSATSTAARLINNGLALDAFDGTGSLTVPVVIPGLTEGDYILGVSRSDGGAAARRFSRPLDAMGNLIFPGMTQGGADATDPNFATRRADLLPITAGTTLASWELFNTLAAPFTSSYTLTLTGCSFCQIPTPGAGALLGLAGLAAFRRRR